MKLVRCVGSRNVFLLFFRLLCSLELGIWVQSSLDSMSIFDACSDLDEALHVLRNARITHMLVPQKKEMREKEKERKRGKRGREKREREEERKREERKREGRQRDRQERREGKEKERRKEKEKREK